MHIIPSDDERFATFLRGALQSLDTPEVPREAMWAAIQAARGSVSAPSSVIALSAGGSATSKGLNDRDGWHRMAMRAIPVRWAMPIAAGVLLTGVGIGVQLGRSHRAVPGAGTSAQTNAAAQVAAQPAHPAQAFQVMTTQHLVDAGQLLARFAADDSVAIAQNARENERVSSWARDLLTTTQLLLDSPTQLDPQRRKLLTDLELVLVQIIQLSPSSLPEDRHFVEQAIEHSQVLERVQSAAEAAGAGAQQRI